MALCWAVMPSERLWDGLGHAGLWGCVRKPQPRVGTVIQESVLMGGPFQSHPAVGGDIWVTEGAGTEPWRE